MEMGTPNDSTLWSNLHVVCSHEKTNNLNRATYDNASNDMYELP